MTDTTEATARVRAFCDAWNGQSDMVTGALVSHSMGRVIPLFRTDLRTVLAAHDAQTAEIARLRAALRWAHNTLWEINPSNYDHDEVCRLNDASVEVILGIAPMIGETHGKTPEWWAARAALKGGDDA